MNSFVSDCAFGFDQRNEGYLTPALATPDTSERPEGNRQVPTFIRSSLRANHGRFAERARASVIGKRILERMSERESLVQLETDSARVNRLTFREAGDETGVHVHDFDYVVVPVTGGDLTIVAEDGSTRELHQVPGESYTGRAGTRHNVISASASTVMFVEIELKTGVTV